MKPTFKTTALAILVSLGAVACSSTSSGEHPLSKQSIQDNNKSGAEQKRLEEEAKIKAEEAQKAKDLEEEAKSKAEEAQKAKDLEEKARLEREAKERAEEAKRLENARIQAELNKIPKTSSVQIKSFSSDDSYIGGDYSTKLYNDSREEDDIKEAIKNNIQKGGKYTGLHKGSYKNTSGSYYPKVIELDDKSFEYGSRKLIAKKIDYNNKDINYLIINNPYSSYGALFVDRHNSDLFAESFTDQDSNFKAGYYIKDGIEYNMASLQGKTFAYKGNIIAVATRAIPNTNVIVNDEPTVDGDIAFKIKFKEKADSNEFSDFVINSKLLGNNINLKNIKLSPCHSGVFCGGNFPSRNDPNDPFNSQAISLHIVDKDANGVVGSIHVSFKEEMENGLYSDKLPKNGLLGYEGVFGATKQ